MLVRLYVVTHRTNGRVYVGITRTTVRRRWGQHVRAAAKGETRFGRAIRRHGRKMFTVRCVETYKTWQEACDAEVVLIAKVRAMGRAHCYNTSDGGDGVKLSGTQLKAHKERMRQRMHEMRADPKIMRNLRKALVASGERSDVQEQRLEQVRLFNTDPKYQAKNAARLLKLNRSKAHRQFVKKMYDDPEFKARISAERRARSLCPEYRERNLAQLRAASLKAAANRPKKKRVGRLHTLDARPAQVSRTSRRSTPMVSAIAIDKNEHQQVL